MTAEPFEFLRDAAPGTLIYGFAIEPELQIDVLVRERSEVIRQTASRPDLQIRGAVADLDGVFVVAVLFALDPAVAVYQSFWNYHHPAGDPGDGNIFDHMASGQNELIFKLLGDSGGVERMLVVRHPLASFFRQTARRLAARQPWTLEQFQDGVAAVIEAHPTPQELWESLG